MRERKRERIMTAIEYLKAKARMTNKCGIECYDCPLSFSNNGIGESCRALERNYPEKAVEIVEKWEKLHTAKTRQSEFLKMFPNVDIDKNGIIAFCPNCVDKDYSCNGSDLFVKCRDCRNKYWSEKIE